MYLLCELLIMANQVDEVLIFLKHKTTLRRESSVATPLTNLLGKSSCSLPEN